jgi:AcrR family transcriptional regulator
MVTKKQQRRELREAIAAEAMAIVGESGLEALSLREVARRLGVSHQAPYKHFPSRDHLTSEMVRRAFANFAQHLDGRLRHEDPRDDLGEMGRAYLQYARAKPLHYRLMFGTPLPNPLDHPDMMESAPHAFSLLQQAIASLPTEPSAKRDPSRVDLDALFVWSTMHGLATILETRALDNLSLPPSVLDAAGNHVLMSIGPALEA